MRFHRADVLYRYVLGQASLRPRARARPFARSPVLTSVLPRLRSTTSLVLLCLALTALALGAPAPAAAETPSAGALYTNGQSGRFLLDGEWYRRGDTADRGRARGWQRSRSLRGWRTTTVPDAANAGDESARSYTGGVWWYRKDFQAPGGAATDWVAALRVGQLPGDRVAERAPRGQPQRRIPPVRGARPWAASHRREPARRAGGQPPRRVGGPADRAPQGRPVHRRLVELRRHPARGLSAPRRHARPRQRHVFPRQSCPTCPPGSTCARWPRTSRTSRSTRGSRARSAATRSSSAARRSRVAASTCSAAARRSRTPRLWSPSDPHLYTVKLAAEHGGGVVQQYTQRTGVRTLEVDDRGRMLLNGKHLALRGASMHEEDPTRGAALGPAEISRQLRPAARHGRDDDALPLPAPPARARAGRPVRDRGLGRGPGLPDGRCAVPALVGAPRSARHGARDGQPRSQPPVGRRVEPREREHVQAGRRLHALPARGGADRAAARPDAGSSASRSPATPRSASRRSTRASTRSG